LQRNLKSGDLGLEEALREADKDEAIGRTRVRILLQNLPGVGRRGAARAMEELGIDPSRRLRGLGSRQREELLARFAGDASAAG
jgi:ribosomal protein S13